MIFTLLDTDNNVLLDTDDNEILSAGTLHNHEGAMVLSQVVDQLRPNAGRLCWRSIVSETVVTATSEEDDNPVTNLANPSTAFVWVATSTDQQDIDVEIGTVIDYIGIARHNLQQAAEIRIQFLVGATYFTVFDWANVPARQVLLYSINEAEPDGIRISIRNNPTPPSIAVLYAGVSTILQRNLYVGHTPITLGRNVSTVGGYSENGQYLGEVVRREGRSTSVQLSNLTPTWYRGELDPFIAQRPRKPAFFAWRPSSYPAEVGYVWLSGSPRPSNQRANGMMEISMEFEGIA